jgi:hypothetical protein
MTSPEEDEEVLDTGGGRLRARNRTLRIELGVAALVLGAAVLVARTLSDGSGSPKAVPSPTPTASTRTYGTGAPDSGSGLLNGMATVSATDGTVIMEPRLPAPTGADPTQCPDSVSCFTVDRVAAPVLAAVRAAFPGAVPESALTVRLNEAPYAQMLWYLQVNVRVGNTQVLVRVQAPSVNDKSDSSVDSQVGNGSIAHVSTTLQQYYVEVQADDPSSKPQSIAPVRRLARDVRLLADA